MMKTIAKVLILLAVATATLAGNGYAAQPGAGVFYDDFNDGSNEGWAVGPGAWSVVDGSYHQGDASPGNKVSTVVGPDYNAPGAKVRRGLRLIGLSQLWGFEYGDFDAATEAEILSSTTREREIGVVFRYKNEGNYYHFRWYSGYTEGDDHFELWKYVNGEGFLLSQVKADYTPTGTKLVFKVSMKGGSIDAQVLAKGKGTSSSKHLEATDSTHAGGLFGLATYATEGSFDNVQVTSQPGNGGA